MDENPYESPTVPSGDVPSSLPARRLALAIVLGILTLPAAGIAFFMTCFGMVVSLERTDSSFDEAFSIGLGAGSLVGLIVAAVMIYFTVRAASRRS